MKIDYTLTPEYREAAEANLRWLAEQRLWAPSCEEKILMRVVSRSIRYPSAVVSDPKFRQAQADRNEYFSLLLGAVVSPEPYHKPESMFRTICKIATRILMVLLLVGIGVGVMLK